MLTDQEVISQQDHAEMIRRPHLWPHVVLPLKRVRDGCDGWYDTAVVVSVTPQGKVAVVENITMFGPIPGEKPKQVLYDSPEEVVAAGWSVD